MTATKRPAEDVKFLATKAVVGALSVGTFLGAWGLIAATAAPVGGEAEPVDQPAAAQPPPVTGEAPPALVIERQVIYIIGSGGAAPSTGSAPAPQSAPAVAPTVAAAAPAPPPAPRQSAPAPRTSRGS